MLKTYRPLVLALGLSMACASLYAADAHTFSSIDTDHDGRISRTEFAAAHNGKDNRFSSIDSNGDGFISKEEFDAHHAKMQPAANADKAKTDSGHAHQH